MGSMSRITLSHRHLERNGMYNRSREMNGPPSSAGVSRIAAAEAPTVRSKAVGWMLLAGPENLKRIGWQGDINRMEVGGRGDGDFLAKLLPGPNAALRKLVELDTLSTLSILAG